MTPLLTKYADPLGLPEDFQPVSLAEGDTPLLPSVRLGPEWGLKRLYFKCDHLSTTGSYKDRFITTCVSWMKRRGQTVCLATSSGNTGSSLAAYSARAGVRVLLFCNELTPSGKLAQMRAHGAAIFRVEGFGRNPEQTQQAIGRLQALSVERDMPLIISAYKYSPEAMLGVRTLGYEILEQMPEPPQAIFLPVGGAGMFVSVAEAMQQMGASVRCEPVQPHGTDTIITPLRNGEHHGRDVDTETDISGLNVPMNIDGDRALALCHRMGSRGYLVDEGYVREIQARLYHEEGLAVEPAGAVSVAGLAQAAEAGALDPEAPVVAVLTGQGFKDPESEAKVAESAPLSLVKPEEISASLWE